LEITNVYQGKLLQPHGEKEDLHEMPTDSSYSRPSNASERNSLAVGIEIFDFDDSSRPSYHTRATIQTNQKEPSHQTIKIGVATSINPKTVQLFPFEDKQGKISRLNSLPVRIYP
jgi:hypothetical protein